MSRKRIRMLACIGTVPLLAIAATVTADEVLVPGETYTPDLIGPWAIDSYKERQAMTIERDR